MAETSPQSDDYLLIGTVVASFGVRGQVKVRSYTDHVEHLRRRIHAVFIGPQHTEYRLSSVFEHKPGLLIMTLDGVTTREQADALVKSEVAIRETQAAPLADDEYFIHQLYNLQVVTDSGEEIGSVREVLLTGANEVLVVPRRGKSDALIPMIHDVVRELDVANGRIIIHPIAGLLD